MSEAGYDQKMRTALRIKCIAQVSLDCSLLFISTLPLFSCILQFVLPSCSRCGGVLKPDVVMFGDNVPSDRVAQVADEVDRADALLVVGTSLEVFSAFRFVVRASKRSVPIAIVNYGETRAERQQLPSIAFKSSTNCAVLLQQAVQSLAS